MGTVTLSITPLHAHCSIPLLTDLVSFMASWGVLGARAQMGFGVVKIVSGESNGDVLLDFLRRNQGNHDGGGFPALHQMFFAQLTAKGSEKLTEQHTFLLKHDIRRLFGNASLRHEVMGWVQPNSDNRAGARIYMSRPYGGSARIRLWGWVPKLSIGGENLDRDRDVLQKIFAYVKSGTFQLQSWREWSSPRDPGHDGESRVGFFDRLRKEPWQ